MKVALVTEFFAPHLGGQEFRFDSFANALTSMGADVDVYTIDYTGKLPKREKAGKFDIYRHVTIKGYSSGTKRSIKNTFDYAVACADLIDRIHDSYDKIIVNQMPVMHLLYIKPYDNVIIDWCEYWPSGLKHMLLNKAIKRFRNGICVSSYILDKLKTVNPDGNFKLFYTPIDTAKYKTDKKKGYKRIFYLGRLAEHKNIANLVKAVIAANENSKEKFSLTIAGEGPLIDTIKRTAKNHRYIKILGRVSDKDKIKFFKQSDIFAIPSKREGMPNTILEAMAAKLPILTVKSEMNNAAAFVKHNNIGFVAESSSVPSIERSILMLDQTAAERMRLNEMKLIKLIDSKAAGKKILDIIKDSE